MTCDLGNLPKTGERVRTCALRGAGAVAVEDAGPCRGAECNDIWGNSAAPVASRVPFSHKKAYATLQQVPVGASDAAIHKAVGSF